MGTLGKRNIPKLWEVKFCGLSKVGYVDIINHAAFEILMRTQVSVSELIGELNAVPFLHTIIGKGTNDVCGKFWSDEGNACVR